MGLSDKSAASIFMTDYLDKDEGRRFLRNVGKDLPGYTASYSRRQYSSCSVMKRILK
jgi:hypothetical protein